MFGPSDIFVIKVASTMLKEAPSVSIIEIVSVLSSQAEVSSVETSDFCSVVFDEFLGRPSLNC